MDVRGFCNWQINFGKNSTIRQLHQTLVPQIFRRLH